MAPVSTKHWNSSVDFPRREPGQSRCLPVGPQLEVGHSTRQLTAPLHKAGYALDVKLARGAYTHTGQIAHQRTMFISSDPDPSTLFWVETNMCYNTCTSVVMYAASNDIKLSSVSSSHLGVLFETRSWGSSELVLQELIKNGLVREEGGKHGPQALAVP
ncbi:hypothetical protein EDD16DRAFT_255842 [Pisolithus croceorrhizus]|nr:hypothetical protein EDD16DRAFT_255842 [Pisolithus croceorrhizus]KAI6116551.1 hypothetical protein EV401DRAFT_2073171 [Pisolithus croceorrhizus]